MDSSASPAPLGDNINGGSDSRQRKRDRDKARWQAMSQEKRDERNKKRREAYKRRKEQLLHMETTNELIDGQDASDKENMDPNDIDDWLHRNDSLHANNIDDILISNRLLGN